MPFIVTLTLIKCYLTSSTNNPKELVEVQEALDQVHKVEDLFPIMKVISPPALFSEFLAIRGSHTSTVFDEELRN